MTEFSYNSDTGTLTLSKWHINICDGNRCAATVLSYLINTEQKLSPNSQEQEDGYHYYSPLAIEEGIFNLYGKAAIIRALKFLEQKGLLLKHQDKANFYQLCHEALQSHNIKNKE